LVDFSISIIVILYKKPPFFSTSCHFAQSLLSGLVFDITNHFLVIFGYFDT